MAVDPSSTPETLDPVPIDNNKPEPIEIPPPSTPQHPPAASTPPPAADNPTPPNPNSNPSPVADNPTPPDPNPNPSPVVVAPPPPAIPSFAPSFRPVGAPPVMQYSTYPPNPYYPIPQGPPGGIQPPGVSGAMYTGQPAPPPMYAQAPPNGYMMPPGATYQAPPQPGVVRYPPPYPQYNRPPFPPRPPMGLLPQLHRPPLLGLARPPVTLVRPMVPSVAAPEKPQTTVYVGKIAPTVDNEFLLSLLRLCGPVKSWKRAQDPSDGTPKGFGFCEFESAEGILRAMRLMSKLNIDGQELVLNINQATREYLERYVEKKTEREKLKENEGQVAEGAPGVQSQEPPKSVVEETKKDVENTEDKENHEKTQNFGIVSDEDRDADKDASEKITTMLEERLKTKPLPPPPPVQTPTNGSARSNSEAPSKSRDGDSDVDIMKSDAAEEKNDDETTSGNKLMPEPERPGTASPDKSRRLDRSSREGDKEREKREKERELERYERERERERVRREREREREIREAERFYKDRVKEWEAREREKEYQRQKEREREKEHQRDRRREISKDENESDDEDTRKRRRRSNAYEEKRRKRQREKEEDLADRIKEEEEIAEAKRRAIEEQLCKDDSKPLLSPVIDERVEEPTKQESDLFVESREDVPEDALEDAPDHMHQSASGSDNNTGTEVYSNDEPAVGSATVSEAKQNINAPTRKLGFGLVGSGKRTTVPSVFHEEEDEDADDKKMRPLVPIDYSTEELQAVHPSASVPSPNLAAAAEFAKRISHVNPKEDKRETERERNGRSNDRSSQKERDRTDDTTRSHNESKGKMHDRIFDRESGRVDKLKTDNKKLLDAKQLIDMIPKTKEELFAYKINWTTYDKYELHERMRPWISKKITEFLGEDEPTLVDYIVSSTKDHVQASKMLELLQSILDEEAEMFVLKMWRMLIFEIKKVDAGLSGKSRE